MFLPNTQLQAAPSVFHDYDSLDKHMNKIQLETRVKMKNMFCCSCIEYMYLPTSDKFACDADGKVP